MLGLPYVAGARLLWAPGTANRTHRQSRSPRTFWTLRITNTSQRESVRDGNDGAMGGKNKTMRYVGRVTGRDWTCRLTGGEQVDWGETS